MEEVEVKQGNYLNGCCLVVTLLGKVYLVFCDGLSHFYLLSLRYCGLAVLCLLAQSCPTLCNPVDCSPPGSSLHGDSPGQNTRVGSRSLLQGIFPTQGSNAALKVDFLPTEPPGKPKSFSGATECSRQPHMSGLLTSAFQFFR